MDGLPPPLRGRVGERGKPQARADENTTTIRHHRVTHARNRASSKGEAAMDARSPQLEQLQHAMPVRGWRPPGCDRVALVLQGGGALGAYQCGVYQALHEGGVEPDWVCGVSIGAINSAIIAGNPARRRLDRLQEFWHRITDRKIW